MRTWINIYWLGTKELRSIFSDVFLLVLIAYSFSLAIYSQSTSMGETVNNASIAFVDEDRSALSRKLQNAFYPPYFQRPQIINASDVDRAMDQNRFMFVVVIPPDLEKDVRRGRQPSIQVNIDATAVAQANLGAAYIQNILLQEISRFATRSDTTLKPLVELVNHRAFNPNGTQAWFRAIVSLLDQLLKGHQRH